MFRAVREFRQTIFQRPKSKRRTHARITRSVGACCSVAVVDDDDEDDEYDDDGRNKV